MKLKGFKHKGVALTFGRYSAEGPIRFAVRLGRSVGYAPLHRLNREWLDAYVNALEAYGKHSLALDFKLRWLASPPNEHKINGPSSNVFRKTSGADENRAQN